MTPEHISSFLSNSIPDIVRCLRAALCHLRVFLRYLYLNELTKDDLSLFIPKSNVLLKRKHIPTTWTREDIDKILACIDLASPVGKRDYAIILLVARLGVRAVSYTHLSLRFLLQQLIQCFFHAATDHFLKLTLDYFLV